MAVDVGMQAGAERLVTKGRDELLDDGRALLVGDGIEVSHCLVRVIDRSRHRVGRRQLVLAVGCGAHLAVEHEPGVREARRVSQAAVGQVRRERLVQPQVIPPTHRDQVTEPHMCELMKDDLTPDEPLVVGRWIAEEEAVVEGDGTHVLHGPGVELGHEELVVLAERIRAAEEIGVVVHALAGDLEDLVGAALELGLHRHSPEDPEG